MSIDNNMAFEFVQNERRLKELKAEQDAITARQTAITRVLTEQIQLQTEELGVPYSINVDGRQLRSEREIYARPRNGDQAALVTAFRCASLDQYIETGINPKRLNGCISGFITAWEQAGHISTDLTLALPEPLRGAVIIAPVYKIKTRASK